MYRINYFSTVNNSPNFGIGFFRKPTKQVAKKSSDILKNKGVSIVSCGKVSNRKCNTNPGVVELNYKNENYKCIIPNYLIKGGYFDRTLWHYIPYSVDEEKVSALILERFKLSRESSMQKFLENCEHFYQSAT